MKIIYWNINNLLKNIQSVVFLARENKSGPCKLKVNSDLPDITVKDLNNKDINLKDESAEPLVVISGSMS